MMFVENLINGVSRCLLRGQRNTFFFTWTNMDCRFPWKSDTTNWTAKQPQQPAASINGSLVAMNETLVSAHFRSVHLRDPYAELGSLWRPEIATLETTLVCTEAMAQVHGVDAELLITAGLIGCAG